MAAFVGPKENAKNRMFVRLDCIPVDWIELTCHPMVSQSVVIKIGEIERSVNARRLIQSIKAVAELSDFTLEKL